jgi:pyruvate formate lyase activating enzyme
MKPVLMFRKKDCTVCGRCIAVCPQKANSVAENTLVLDRKLCNACGACVEACLGGYRSIQGALMTVKEVMDVVVKDYRTYENSGGGITVSGGATELQPEFSAGLLKYAHAEGIHTCAELTGAFPWSTVKSITDHCDYILYDLKHLDSAKHKEGVGVHNNHVLENAKHLVGENKKIVFRMPLIPGFNDSHESVRAVAGFVRNELGLSPADHIELLPYNNLGEEKYERMDFEGKHPVMKRQSNEYLKELENIISSS